MEILGPVLRETVGVPRSCSDRKKKTGHTTLERREIGTMLLPVVGKERAEGVPRIAVESFAITARSSVRDYVGTERVARQI